MYRNYKIGPKIPSFLYIPGTSPSVAAVPHADRGLSGKSSAPPIFSTILRADMESLKYSLQPSVAQSRHRVLPVPVGLSRTPLTFYNRRSSTFGFHKRDGHKIFNHEGSGLSFFDRRERRISQLVALLFHCENQHKYGQLYSKVVV